MASSPPSTPLLASAVPRVGVAVFILHPTVPSPASETGSETQTPSDVKAKFIMGQRINAHGSGTWALPGGHLEFGETLEECAAREVLEETGLTVEDVRFLTATNDVMPFEVAADEKTAQGTGKAKGRHYVTIFMTARVKRDPKASLLDGGSDIAGETEMPTPQLLEPHKCKAWEWVAWEEMVRWASADVNSREGRRGLPSSGLDVAAAAEGNEGGNDQGEGGGEGRKLFSPLLALLDQRPGVVPSLES